MINAALNGELDQVQTETHPIFNFSMPLTCPNVQAGILNPRNTWDDKNQYDQKAKQLAAEFNANFEKYKSGTDAEVGNAGPKSC
jgi:phosphoenolpyruvate carboxykinase (ATP)